MPVINGEHLYVDSEKYSLADFDTNGEVKQLTGSSSKWSGKGDLGGCHNKLEDTVRFYCCYC